MPKYAFSTDPFVVREGKSDPAPERAWEESLTEIVSNDWVNAEYKHLVVKASPKALTAKPGDCGFDLANARAALEFDGRTQIAAFP